MNSDDDKRYIALCGDKDAQEWKETLVVYLSWQRNRLITGQSWVRVPPPLPPLPQRDKNDWNYYTLHLYVFIIWTIACRRAVLAGRCWIPHL